VGCNVTGSDFSLGCNLTGSDFSLLAAFIVNAQLGCKPLLVFFLLSSHFVRLMAILSIFSYLHE
jgi:hypothetical protein